MIVVNPYDYDKETAYLEAIAHCLYFTSENGIDSPEIRRSSKISGFGLYYDNNRKIVINVKRCRLPAKNPGYAWSYTGWKADLTVGGVLAHEVGHHCEKDSEITYKEWRRHCRGERPPTSYAPNWREDFAESMKIFILNPDLLQYGRPKRYELLAAVFSQTIEATWQEILIHAHEKYKFAAIRWAAAGKKKK